MNWKPIETIPRDGHFMLWISNLPWPGYTFDGQIWSNAHGRINHPEEGYPHITKAKYWAPMMEGPK